LVKVAMKVIPMTNLSMGATAAGSALGSPLQRRLALARRLIVLRLHGDKYGDTQPQGQRAAPG
jgi:hypothetical protein